MRIINRKTFLELPPGIIYSKYKPCIFDNLAVKEESLFYGDESSSNEESSSCRDDFYYAELSGIIECSGSEQLVDRLEEMRLQGASYLRRKTK